MKATTIGIDLAKHLFQLHGVDQHGKTVLKRQLKRDQMLSFFSNLPPSLIGMEACGSAHYWANKLQGLGHTVKLMAPQFVKPYVKTNKNDAADAEAICEAVTRPTMRFVPIKSSEQLAILALHRARQGFIKARTAQANQIRGLLAEYGFILPQGITHIGKHVPELLEDSENGLPGTFRHLLMRLHEHLKMLDKQVNELEDAIVRWHKDSAASQTLAQLPGIGPITASALVASIGNAKNFKNGRQLAAWLGLVPRQHSSGGKQNLLGIDMQVNELEEQIWYWHKENSASQKLAKMPGIGPLTASALVASIGDAKQFENGRQLAARLGLVPKQHSSGGKQTLLGISKRGDIYLRTLLIHGARAVLRVAERKTEYAGSWLAGVMERRNHNVTIVALANKNARIIWALLAHEREYDADYAVAT